MVHCAAGLRIPVEEMVRSFEKETGQKVQLQYGASQALLAGIRVAKSGDLFLPADDSYLKDAGADVREVLPMASMRAVLVTAKGNPLALRSLTDVMRPGVRLVQANPDAAAIGKLTKAKLADRWSPLEKATIAFKLTVNDVATDVKLGAAGAGIVWDVVAAAMPELETVALPELDDVRAKISAGVLTVSPQPAAALRLARWFASRDRGAPVWRKYSAEPANGDAWTAQPELRLMAGAMLRPAIEQTIIEFEKREGCRVTRVYNGCGILVSQMKAAGSSGPGDAFFACDSSFMAQVTDLFPNSESISGNQLVILVKKGNPHGIRTLTDLGKPGLRVGVGHEKQCALGQLTKTTFLTAGVTGAVAKNIAVQSPTGDLLVNQLRTGSLDAVVAYVSNAAGSAQELDAFAIDLPCAMAAQPFAVAKDAPSPQLAARLGEALRSTASRERFEASGFTWRGGGLQPPSSRIQ